MQRICYFRNLKQNPNFRIRGQVFRKFLFSFKVNVNYLHSACSQIETAYIRGVEGPAKH